MNIIENRKNTVRIIEKALSFKIILEFDVYTIEREYAGVGEDILLDKQGKPTFLILEYDSKPVFFKRYIAVPFSNIEIDLYSEIICICWNKKKLDESPDFFFDVET